MPLTSVAIALLGLILGGWLAVAFRRLEGSTLRAPVVWAALAIAAVVAAEIWILQGAVAQPSSLRYLAAAVSFCPAMALLGAKRPQDRGWQFVVATLWLVLALPAFQAMVYAPRGPLELHPAWRGFLTVLIVMAVSNYLPTRHVAAALLAGTGQGVLLYPHTPIPWNGQPTTAVLTALAIWAVAASLVGSGWPRRRSTTSATNRVWLDFRDAFGAVWALRVMERINQAARQAGQQGRLGWQGFSENWDPLSTSSSSGPDPLQVTVRMLLRRFVSPAWVARRGD